jgi:nucleoside-diphosphate-sugar epimerase
MHLMSQASNVDKPLVAGASGFVGSHLRDSLKQDYRFRALTRSASAVAQNPSAESTEWRRCDLYSLPRVTEALAGCDYGIYLVHSMAPSSRLVQGNFEDTDLLLADNFISAAESAEEPIGSVQVLLIFKFSPVWV